MRVVRKNARVPSAGRATEQQGPMDRSRKSTAHSGTPAHLASQQPVSVVAESTFVGTAQRLQSLPAATLRRHGPPEGAFQSLCL